MKLVARGYRVYIGKTYKGEVDFIAEKGDEKFYVQAAYLLSDEHVVEREFSAYESINDNYPKYVITMDPWTRNRDGIIHLNLIDFLLNKAMNGNEKPEWSKTAETQGKHLDT